MKTNLKIKNLITIVLTLFSIMLLSFNTFAEYRYYYDDNTRDYTTDGGSASGNSSYSRGHWQQDTEETVNISMDYGVQIGEGAGLKSMRMRQDDTYYYFDFVIKYEIPGLTAAPYSASKVRDTSASHTTSNGYTETINIVDSNEYLSSGGGLYVTNAPSGSMSENYTMTYEADNQWNDHSNNSNSSSSGHDYDRRRLNGSVSMFGAYGSMSWRYRDDSTYSYTDRSSRYTPNYYNNGGGSGNINTIYSTMTLGYPMGAGNMPGKNYVQPITAGWEVAFLNMNNQRVSGSYYGSLQSGTLRINKDAVLSGRFRYLRMVDFQAKQTYDKNYWHCAWHGSDSDTKSTSQTNYDITYDRRYKTVYSTDSIDLMRYIHCNASYEEGRIPPYIDTDDIHDWRIQYINDRHDHQIYCPNCQWSHKSPHRFVYEYDGMRNDLCICGLMDKCNYYYNVDSDTYGQRVQNGLETLRKFTEQPNSSYHSGPIISDTETKIGYAFDGYEKYIKTFPYDEVIYIYNNDIINLINITPTTRFNAISTPLIEKHICDIAPTEIGDATLFPNANSVIEPNSVIYKVKWKPVVFHITFKKGPTNVPTSEYNPIGDFGDQEVRYGLIPTIPEHEYVSGWQFEGWSLTSGSSVADFDATGINTGEGVATVSDISRLTTTYGATFELYPVYKKRTYTIHIDDPEKPDPDLPTPDPDWKEEYKFPDITNPSSSDYDPTFDPTNELPEKESWSYDFGDAIFWICAEDNNGIPGYGDDWSIYKLYETWDEIINYIESNDMRNADLHFIPYFEKSFNMTFRKRYDTSHIELNGENKGNSYTYTGMRHSTFSEIEANELPIVKYDTIGTFDYWFCEEYYNGLPTDYASKVDEWVFKTFGDMGDMLEYALTIQGVYFTPTTTYKGIIPLTFKCNETNTGSGGGSDTDSSEHGGEPSSPSPGPGGGSGSGGGGVTENHSNTNVKKKKITLYTKELDWEKMFDNLTEREIAYKLVEMLVGEENDLEAINFSALSDFLVKYGLLKRDYVTNNGLDLLNAINPLFLLALLLMLAGSMLYSYANFNSLLGVGLTDDADDDIVEKEKKTSNKKKKGAKK